MTLPRLDHKEPVELNTKDIGDRLGRVHAARLATAGQQVIDRGVSEGGLTGKFTFGQAEMADDVSQRLPVA